MAERLVRHHISIVAPLPFIFAPIKAATNPFHTPCRIGLLQILSQPTIFQLDRFGQSAVPVFACKMSAQPVLLCIGYEIALATDPYEMWRTQCVHSLRTILFIAQRKRKHTNCEQKNQRKIKKSI